MSLGDQQARRTAFAPPLDRDALLAYSVTHVGFVYASLDFTRSSAQRGVRQYFLRPPIEGPGLENPLVPLHGERPLA